MLVYICWLALTPCANILMYRCLKADFQLCSKNRYFLVSRTYVATIATIFLPPSTKKRSEYIRQKHRCFFIFDHNHQYLLFCCSKESISFCCSLVSLLAWSLDASCLLTILPALFKSFLCSIFASKINIAKHSLFSPQSS